MMVTTALILQANNPNELQGVIAHEVGHLAGGHSFRSGEDMRAGMVPMILTMGLGVLAAIAGSGDAAAGLISSAPYFGALGAARLRPRAGEPRRPGRRHLHGKGRPLRRAAWPSSSTSTATRRSSPRCGATSTSSTTRCSRTGSRRCRTGWRSCRTTIVKDSPEALAEHEIMKAKLDGFINPRRLDEQVRREGHVLSGPLCAGDRLLPDEGAGEGAEAGGRAAGRAAEQSLPLGAQGPDHVRVRPGRGRRSRRSAARSR